MTVRLGTNNVRLIELPNGSLAIAINGKILRDHTFIFQADALKAAQAYIEAEEAL
jgi:hypothetical protein